MPFETIREQLSRAARMHDTLRHRYATLGALAEGRAREFCDELASQEARLASGLEQMSRDPDAALDAYVQNPRPTPPLRPATDDLDELPALAAEWDEAIASIYESLRTLGTRRVLELVDAFDANREARARARARWVTIRYGER